MKRFAHSLQTLRFESPKKMIEQLTPTKTLLCAIPGRMDGNQNLIIGFALSDPYLGSALPLNKGILDGKYCDSHWNASVLMQICNDGDVGALVLAPNPGDLLTPFATPTRKDTINNARESFCSLKDFIELVNSDHNILHQAGIKHLCKWEYNNVEGSYIEDQCRNNDWWAYISQDILENERLKKKGLDLDQKAAIMLQLFMDAHIGGWENTFG